MACAWLIYFSNINADYINTNVLCSLTVLYHAVVKNIHGLVCVISTWLSQVFQCITFRTVTTIFWVYYFIGGALTTTFLCLTDIQSADFLQEFGLSFCSPCFFFFFFFFHHWLHMHFITMHFTSYCFQLWLRYFQGHIYINCFSLRGSLSPWSRRYSPGENLHRILYYL